MFYFQVLRQTAIVYHLVISLGKSTNELSKANCKWNILEVKFGGLIQSMCAESKH